MGDPSTDPNKPYGGLVLARLITRPFNSFVQVSLLHLLNPRHQNARVDPVVHQLIRRYIYTQPTRLRLSPLQS